MRLISRRRASAVILGALASSASAAALAQSQDAISKAKSEGRATVYGVVDPTSMVKAFQAFKAKYGIDVDYVRLTSAPLGQRFSAESESGNASADIIIMGDPLFLAKAKSSGWLASPADLPGEPLPAQVWDGTLAVMSLNPQSLAWNTDLVKDRPTGWKALIDPKWQGKVAVFDPRNGLPGLQWCVAMREAFGDDFLTRLGKQSVLANSAVTGLQQVAAGAMSFYAPAIHVVVDTLTAKGAPIADALFEPLLPGEQWAAISAHAPHPTAARLLMSFLMSTEGQAIVNKDGYSARPSIPGTLPLPKTTSVSPEKAQAQLNDVLRLMGLL
jgi:iron(III) transport system substrate-binding protein